MFSYNRDRISRFGRLWLRWHSRGDINPRMRIFIPLKVDILIWRWINGFCWRRDRLLSRPFASTRTLTSPTTTSMCFTGIIPERSVYRVRDGEDYLAARRFASMNLASIMMRVSPGFLRIQLGCCFNSGLDVSKDCLSKHFIAGTIEWRIFETTKFWRIECGDDVDGDDEDGELFVSLKSHVKAS